LQTTADIKRQVLAVWFLQRVYGAGETLFSIIKHCINPIKIIDEFD
jgi:hypothetical protein